MYFIPKFCTIQTPNPTVSHYIEERVVGEFNRVQREQGKQECSNGNSHNWLKTYRPKVSICPHQEDYCDTCAKSKSLIHSKQTTITIGYYSLLMLPLMKLRNSKMSYNV